MLLDGFQVVGADGRRFKLIDTAGIRKRARVSSSIDGAEPLSVGRAINAVRCAAAQQLPIVSILLACGAPMRASVFACNSNANATVRLGFGKPHILRLERPCESRAATWLSSCKPRCMEMHANP